MFKKLILRWFNVVEFTMEYKAEVYQQAYQIGHQQGYAEGYDEGYKKGRDMEFRTAQNHAAGMAAIERDNTRIENSQGMPFNREFYNLVNADVIENKRKKLEREQNEQKLLPPKPE